MAATMRAYTGNNEVAVTNKIIFSNGHFSASIKPFDVQPDETLQHEKSLKADGD